MGIAVLAVLLATLQLYGNAVTSATKFNCHNKLITDDWRQMVLERHNTLRARLANGEQRGSGNNNILPKAANMNKLHWDCNIELLIDEKIKECNANTAEPANAAYGVAKEMIRVGNRECDAKGVTRTTLNKWWNDGAAKQAAATVTTENAFSQMALAKAYGFACSYRGCGGNLFLVCFYNLKAKKNEQLYTDTQTTCDDCPKYPVTPPNQKVECAAFLCQYPLDPAATVDLKMCGANNPCPGTFSDLFRLTALNMHNYYRRLLATGWAPNGEKYAPMASKMIELKYDRDLEEKANTYVTNVNCPSAAEGGVYGENFWMTRNFNIPHEEAIKMAIEQSWWKPYEDSKGFGDKPTYTDVIRDGNLKYAANMLHEGTTKIGCAVKTCEKEGRLVIDCRYDNRVQEGDDIYATGKVCSKCRTTATPNCSNLGGLCVA